MGNEFLDKNKENEDVVCTESGLQFRVLKNGKGKSPKAKDKVVVHYTGKLVNGREFDSSHKRGTPAGFKVNAVIRGWSEALQMMNQGAKWELFIPPELGYGKKGVPGVIPPDAVLIFEVELIKIKSSFFGF